MMVNSKHLVSYICPRTYVHICDVFETNSCHTYLKKILTGIKECQNQSIK